MTTKTALRTAQFAEAVYALIAGGLAFGIPLPPRGPNVVLFAHYLGSALLAAAIVLRLRRPNRQMWYVAALLSGYVLFNAAVAIIRLLGPQRDSLGRPGVAALAVGGTLWAAQAVVAYCLYAAREIRTMPLAPRGR